MSIITLGIVLFIFLQHNLSFLVYIMLGNVILILLLGRTAISHILFPFGQKLGKYYYHQQMNEKMTKEMQTTLVKVEEIIDKMSLPEYTLQLAQVFSSKDGSYQFKKLIDYLNLFIDVNTELIQSDEAKKKLNKRTRRFPITSEFNESTQLMINIKQLLNDIKVVSIVEM